MSEYVGEYGVILQPFASEERSEPCFLTYTDDYFPPTDLVEKKEKQEPWSTSEDVLLAEKVLSHIREGKKQVDAFEEVANLIGRTPGAASIRWNAYLKHQHFFDLRDAKAERLKRKKEEQAISSASSRTRADSWDKEEDLLVANTVIRHIETASTQLKAFEECSKKINRTVAAIGFRWNSELRHFYEEQIEEAKRKRIDVLAERILTKRTKQTLPSVSEPPLLQEEIGEEFSSLDWANIQFEHVQLQAEYRKLEAEKEALTARNAYLEKRIYELEEKELFISEDYENFFKILEQARKLMVIK